MTIARKHRALLGAIVVGLTITVATGAYWLFGRTRSGTAADTSTTSLGEMEVVQLTTTGTAAHAAISPDGRYVAYVQWDGSKPSLWVRQTSIDGAVQLVAGEAGVEIRGTAFTPDGNEVDFLRRRAGVSELLRVPTLGGRPPRPIASEPSRRLAGRQMAHR
jgi:hypothetical protein